jgi:hypothetical protein
VEILTLNVVEHTVNNGVQTVRLQRYKMADTLMIQFYLHDGLQQKLRQRQMTLLRVVYESLSVITSLNKSQTTKLFY